MMTRNWTSLSSDEKFHLRFDSWRNPDKAGFSALAWGQYQERTQMIKDAIELKKPSRIPVCPMIGFFPTQYSGITLEEAMYDYIKLGSAWKRFHQDFLPDSLSSSFLVGPGKVLEMLDYKQYKWPGHGTAPNISYQYLEDEYMYEDEYDLLINDPSNFWMRVYMPRIFGALKPLEMISPFTDLLELPFVGTSLTPMGRPEVQASLLKLLEVSRAAMEWSKAIDDIDGTILTTLGVPPILNSFCKAPFDILGDTLRGTRSIMLDLYRRPKKILLMLDRLVPLSIELGVRTATDKNTPFVFMPLHKGSDDFLSKKDFARFYWPTLKEVILGLIREGLVPFLFVQGSYNQRFDFLADPDIPPGRTLWLFDSTDMKRVKLVLGERACFAGNVSGSLLKAGTPGQVKEYVKVLIQSVGSDGGFILSTGSTIDDAEPENLQAMIESGIEFGS